MPENLPKNYGNNTVETIKSPETEKQRLIDIIGAMSPTIYNLAGFADVTSNRTSLAEPENIVELGSLLGANLLGANISVRFNDTDTGFNLVLLYDKSKNSLVYLVLKSTLNRKTYTVNYLDKVNPPSLYESLRNIYEQKSKSSYVETCSVIREERWVILGKNYLEESKNAKKEGWSSELSIGSKLNATAVAYEIIDRIGKGLPLPSVVGFSTGPTAGKGTLGKIPTESEAMYSTFVDVLKQSLPKADFDKIFDSGVIFLFENKSTTTKSNATETRQLFDDMGIGSEEETKEDINHRIIIEQNSLTEEMESILKQHSLRLLSGVQKKRYDEIKVRLGKLKVEQRKFEKGELVKPQIKDVKLWTLGFHLPRSVQMFEKYGNMEVESMSTDDRVVEFLHDEREGLAATLSEIQSNLYFYMNLPGFKDIDIKNLIKTLVEAISEIDEKIKMTKSYQNSSDYKFREKMVETLGIVLDKTGLLAVAEKLVKDKLRNE